MVAVGSLGGDTRAVGKGRCELLHFVEVGGMD